jgi:hypothetical protein
MDISTVREVEYCGVYLLGGLVRMTARARWTDELYVLTGRRLTTPN